MSCRILSADELGVLGRTMLSGSFMGESDLEDPRVKAWVQDTARDLYRLSRANLRGFLRCYQGRHWAAARASAPTWREIAAAILKAKPSARDAVEAAMMLHYNSAAETALLPREAERLGDVMSHALGIAHRAMA